MIVTGTLVAIALAAAPRIAVMPIAAGDAISDKAASVLTEALAAEIRQQSGAEVVTARDLGSLLSLEKQKQALGCTTDTCMAEIAGAAGADRLVAGDVAKLAESLILQLRVIDTRKARVVAQSRRRYKQGTLDDVLDALPAVVSELLRSGPPAASAPTQAGPSTPAVAIAGPAGTGPAAGEVVLHYRRRDGAYRHVSLVTWSSAETGAELRQPTRSIVPRITPANTAKIDQMAPGVSGLPRVSPTGTDGWGAYWKLPASKYPNGRVNFVISNASDWEECGADVGRFWIVQDGREAWYLGTPHCELFTDAEAARRAAQGD